MTQQDIQAQAAKFLGQMAGYVGVRTIQIGLSSGLLEEVSRHADGITARALAGRTGFDGLYVEVWCKAAYANEILDVGADETYRLAPHVDQLMLNADSPGYIGGIPALLAAGVTDVRVRVSVPGDRAAATGYLADVVTRFRAAAS